MKRIITLLFLLCIINGLFSQPCREVIGYYPGWQWYDRDQLVNPQSIDYTQYTIINYAFFRPNSDVSITGTDSWADEQLLLGQNDWVNGGYLPNTSLIDLAHNNNVKVLLSIGGWNDSNNFPGIAADPAKRTTFANNCVNLIEQYNFDGIDIDWEYPGYEEHNGTPQDKVNFTLLLQEIRDAIDAYGVQQEREYLLTSCFSADPDKADDIEWDNVVNILDMFNLMTYDFYGTWDATSNHNSPLYVPAEGNSDFCTDAAYTMVHQTYGIPSDKINIGIAYYGRSVTGCTGLHQPHSGSADTQHFSDDEGSPQYYNIHKNLSLFTRYWDDNAKVPYLLGDGFDTFVSYDDEESIEIKANYVVANDILGVIIWEITGDYLETSPGSGVISGTPLSDILNYTMCNTTEITEHTAAEDVISIYPNPANDHVYVMMNNSQEPEEGVFRLTDISGRTVLYTTVCQENNIIDINGITQGIYFYNITSGNNSNAGKLIVN